MIGNIALRLKQYEDVKNVIDKAILAGGMKYELDSPREATEWRHRFYRYRRLLSEVFGVDNMPYIHVHISLLKGSSVCDIKVRRIEGKLHYPHSDNPDVELVDFIKNLEKKNAS